MAEALAAALKAAAPEPIPFERATGMGGGD